MKLCHVVLKPRLSGAEILVAHLAVRQQRAQGQVSVVAMDAMEPSYEVFASRMAAAGVEVRIPEGRVSRLGRVTWLRRHLRALRPDAIFAHSVLPAAYARVGALGLGIPVITVLHSADQDDYGERKLEVFEKYVLPKPAAVIAVAPAAAENYRRRMAYTGRAITIANGVDVEAIRSASSERERVRREVLKVDSSARVVLQMGRIAPVKRQIETLSAVEALGAERSIHLVFAGLVQDADYAAELKGRIERSAIRNRVSLLGPWSEPYELLGAADIFVMPSRDEASSVAFLEALASGRAVVASPIPSFAFASGIPGVDFVEPGQESAYASAILSSLERGVERYDRDLSGYELASTVAKYRSLAEFVTGDGQDDS